MCGKKKGSVFNRFFTMGTQTHITGSVRFITCWCQKNGLNRFFFKTVLKRFRRSRSLTSILTDDSVRVETGFSFFSDYGPKTGFF
ncbi:hypothetical protein HanRHA438_Chr04g0173301 [Helianthus annuus]|nr:hypothetical protein HanRHA438_Chr04g0173301 [Helianthus annuus]